MPHISFRNWYKNRLLQWMHRPAPLSLGSAVIFAPHQDDETLGCGGLITRKCQAGAQVWIVFLTDGGRSHQNLISPEEMKETRMREARSAGRVMGVPEERIHFLQFPNGRLDQFQGEAQNQVEEILRAIRPQEVFIPSAWDYHFEHRITAQIVEAALASFQKGDQAPADWRVYEYPIWFWYQWPWIRWASARPDERAALLKRGLRYGFGAAFLTQFRYAVPIRDVLAVKRAALAEYVSQMARPEETAGWTTLEDVANGDFLACFFTDYEVFRPR